jgi:predicted thioredoxin/glutaredoxin
MVALSVSLEPVLDPRLASAAARSPLSGVEPAEVLRTVSGSQESLLEEWIDRIYRALAVGFVRELWWAKGGSLSYEELAGGVREGLFRLWLLAKGSIGRAVLPSDPRLIGENRIVREAEDFILGVGEKLISRVEVEQANLMADLEWRLVAGEA